MKKHSRWAYLLIVGTILGLLAGCASSAQDGESDGIKTYYVGTRGTSLVYTYFDANDYLTGFDVEVIREIGNRIEGVNFEFKTMTLDSCFVSLEADQIDIIANQLVHNADRDLKYIFTEIPYSYTRSMLTVRGDEGGIATLDDMQGKMICLVPTSESTALVNAYNETAETPIEIVFTDTGSAESLNLLATGRIDATIANPITVRNANDELGYGLKSVGEVLSSYPTYFILRQDDESRELAGKIDAALQSMIDDGTLLQISYRFFEEDFTRAS